MAPVDLKVFTAPFTSKTNLFTIIIVTSLFAVFRLAGGSFFGTTAPKSSHRATASEPSSSVDVNPSPQREREDREKSFKFLGGASRDKDPAPTRRVKEEDNGGSSLDEIERAIGLR